MILNQAKRSFLIKIGLENYDPLEPKQVFFPITIIVLTILLQKFKLDNISCLNGPKKIDSRLKKMAV